MKLCIRWSLWALLLGTFVLPLVACTSEGSRSERDTQAQPPAGSEAVPPTDEAPTSPADSPKQSPEAVEQLPAALPETKELEVTVEGETSKVAAALTKSELGYAFYLIEGFEFTPEEPGKDMVFHKEFGEFFLRIEPLGEDVDALGVKSSAEEALKAVGEQVVDTKETFFDEEIRNRSEFILTAGNASGSVTMIGFRANDRLFRLTLNFPLSEAAEGVTPRFFPMIRSIVVTP